MLFRAIAGEPNMSPPGPANDFWFQSLSYSQTGIRVTPMSAMKASAAYACIKVLAETIATLPRQVWARSPDGTVNLAPYHPLQDVIEFQPNAIQSAVEFWEMQIAFGALFGNVYNEIVPGARGAVDTLLPLRPDYMRVNRVGDYKFTYEYTDPMTLRKRTYVEEELFRMPGFSFNGVEGIAPIFFASDPIGLALATEAFGSKFFAKDATPALVLEHPGKVKPEGIQNIKDSWVRQHAGLDNAYSVAVLEEGMKVNAIGVKNIDAQFLETRRYQLLEIARYFRIPPHMIGELEKSSFSNIESQALDFIKYTLRPWLRRIEQRINIHLITNNKTFFVKHDLSDLQIGEVATRYAAYASAITSGWLTRNEVRKSEGRNPIAGLDVPLSPMNMNGGDQPNTPKAPAPNNSEAMQPDYQAVVGDAFERIVSAEASSLTAITIKHTGDAYDHKIAEFYNAKHAPYVIKALTPCYALCKSLGINTKTPEQYAKDYVTFRIHEVTMYSDPAEIAAWANGRAAMMLAGFILTEQANGQ